MLLSLSRIIFLCLFLASICVANPRSGRTFSFNNSWRFQLGDVGNGQNPYLNDSKWRQLNLPHDWSIEGQFSEKAPAGTGGGPLPRGIGWYRKTFTIDAALKGKLIFIQFDGVYRNSEVWINGHYLGKRTYSSVTKKRPCRAEQGSGTAGPAAKVVLTADRNAIKADGTDLSFVTVKIVDKMARSYRRLTTSSSLS